MCKMQSNTGFTFNPSEMIMLPRALITNEKYQKLTTHAALMYGFMFYSVEKENDEHGEYIHDPRKKLDEVFQCGDSIIATSFKRLESCGLILRKKTTFSGPVNIFLLPVDEGDDTTAEVG